jgi:hypothetical protein
MEILMSSDRMYLGPMALATGALILGLGAAAEAAPPAPSSNTLTINAQVPATCSFTLGSPTSGATVSGGVASLTLTNSTATFTSGLVSSAENCNDKSGYTMTVKDTGNGTLTGTTGNTDVLNFQITYDPTGTNKTVTPTTAVQTLFTSAGKVNATKQVQISISNSTGFVTADTYSDTLTFTMTPQ